MRHIMPPEGTTRIRRRFLWLPTTFGRETRWLEFAWIGERVCRAVFGEYAWHPYAFADGPEPADGGDLDGNS